MQAITTFVDIKYGLPSDMFTGDIDKSLTIWSGGNYDLVRQPKGLMSISSVMISADENFLKDILLKKPNCRLKQVIDFRCSVETVGLGEDMETWQ